MSLSERLRAHVEYLSQTIGERHFRKPEALAHAVSYIGRQLAEMGVEVVEQAFEVNGQRFVNLEIVIPRASTGGPDPGCIVVGAHYDTVIGTPGADDNASGVAALLEMVRQLAGERPERTLRFAFFPNEEPPFYPDAGMGSATYAAGLRTQKVPVHFMLSLEMLGYYNDAVGSQRYPPGLSLIYPRRGNFIGFVSNLRSRRALGEVKRAFRASTPFPCESLAAPEWTIVVGLSDHRSFWSQGYAGLMVTDTAFMRNPHYHRPTDTADTLDFQRFSQVTSGLIKAVRLLAQQAA